MRTIKLQYPFCEICEIRTVMFRVREHRTRQHSRCKANLQRNYFSKRTRASYLSRATFLIYACTKSCLFALLALLANNFCLHLGTSASSFRTLASSATEKSSRIGCFFLWRRGRDSNSRRLLTSHPFQGCTIDHSDTSARPQAL